MEFKIRVVYSGVFLVKVEDDKETGTFCIWPSTIQSQAVQKSWAKGFAEFTGFELEIET